WHRYFRAHPAAAPAQADPLDLELALRQAHLAWLAAVPDHLTVAAAALRLARHLQRRQFQPPRWSRARSHRSAPPARSGAPSTNSTNGNRPCQLLLNQYA